MNIHDLIRELREPGTSKIVLLVADGLGGLPMELGSKTELESARTPNLDALAREGVCRLLQQIRVSGVEVFVEPVREHRFVVVFRGDDLGDAVNDTDPQQTGHAPLEAKGADPNSENTARIVNRFVAEAARALKNDAPTNMVTLRGFARYPKIDTMQEVYGVKPVAIAVYPMYRGLARLVGMEVADAGATLGDQMETLKKVWNNYDFFFLHYKYTDSTGEDGNFAAKVEKIELLDVEIPRIRG